MKPPPLHQRVEERIVTRGERQLAPGDPQIQLGPMRAPQVGREVGRGEGQAREFLLHGSEVVGGVTARRSADGKLAGAPALPRVSSVGPR